MSTEPGNVNWRAAMSDATARVIESKARADADRNEYEPPDFPEATYQARLMGNAYSHVYAVQFELRRKRNERTETGTPADAS